jgi:serine/threonine protein kinase
MTDRPEKTETAPASDLPRIDAAPPGGFGIGEVLSGRYEVVRFIASGGMGDVYEVRDLKLHATVALKTIRAGLADDERSQERFRREVLTRAAGRSPRRVSDLRYRSPRR